MGADKITGDYKNTGYVYAPYIPLMVADAPLAGTKIVEHEIVEELPPSDDTGIQVGEGEGPRVEVFTEVELIEPPADAGIVRSSLLERYARKCVDPNLYKTIVVEAAAGQR